MNCAVRRVLPALTLLALAAAPASAAELKVLCAGAMRAALQQLAPAFEKSSKQKLTIEYAPVGKVAAMITADQPFDVAILTKPLFDKQVKAATLVGGDSAVLAHGLIGVAVRQGAAKPDIGTVEAFKQALLGAKSIAYIDPKSGGASGVRVAQVVEKLGIAAQLKAKTRLVESRAGQAGLHEVGEAVQRGEAQIGMQPISELKGVPGIDIVGPLPSELQSPDLTFVAAMSNFSAQPDAAMTFIQFLKSPAAKAAYQEAGLEPAK